MAFDPSTPYNDLPALAPMVDVESRSVLKACISARAAVSELKAAGRRIPNQGVLINSIPLLEAQASSEIENIVTTTDQMFLFDGVSVGEADPATKEPLRYRTALWEECLVLKTRPLSTNTAVQICRAIEGVDMDIRKTPGTTLSNDRTRQVDHEKDRGCAWSHRGDHGADAKRRQPDLLSRAGRTGVRAAVLPVRTRRGGGTGQAPDRKHLSQGGTHGLEAVLADGETLSEFVEASVRASVERRRVHAEFVARGLRSRDEARRTGDYVDADVVLEGLQRKLDAVRVRPATKGK